MMDDQKFKLAELKQWAECATPGDRVLEGRYARLEPLDWAVHEQGLYDAVGGQGGAGIWHFMPVGPFTDGSASFGEAFSMIVKHGNWRTMVIRSRESGAILGMVSYMRLRGAHGSCEIGCVAFSDALKRTRIATEAVFLAAQHVFDDLGFRRFEWKCDSDNAASVRAAERFGFTYEGTFRQDMVVKGRNRNSAWYAMLDREWPQAKAAFQAWLHPDNFEADGQQKAKLESYRAAL